MTSARIYRITMGLAASGLIVGLFAISHLRAEEGLLGAPASAQTETAQPQEPAQPLDGSPLAEGGEVQERAVIRDRLMQPRIFSTPQPPPPPTASPAPNIVMPGVIGKFPNANALPQLSYDAGTPSLTLVANAIRLQSKSLTTVLSTPPGLMVTTPVEIIVEYLSPASPQQVMTQMYTPQTGNHLVRHDLVGDGKLRRQFMTIRLIEKPAAGTGAQYTMNWQVDLDPLFNIDVGSLRFKLLDDCDWVGKSEIQLAWVKPDKSFGAWSLSRRKGQLVTVSDFAWSGRAVSAKSGLVQPYAVFKESDPCVTMDCLFGLSRPFSPAENLPPLIPGRTDATPVIKRPEGGDSCRAEMTFPILYVLYVDPALAQPMTAALQPIIVDNSDPSVQRFGTWRISTSTAGFYGPNSETTDPAPPINRFRWIPTIPVAGQYDVYVWWMNNPNRSLTVPHTVHHAGGDTVKTYNQQTGGNQWVLHGRYSFAAGTSSYVEVNNANGQAGADAVQFVRVP